MGFYWSGLFFDIQLACIHIGKAQKCDTSYKVTVLMARGDVGGRIARHLAGVGFVVCFFIFLFPHSERVRWHEWMVNEASKMKKEGKSV